MTKPARLAGHGGLLTPKIGKDHSMLMATIACAEPEFQAKTRACVECRAELARHTANKKFCEPCMQERLREKAREYQRRKRGGLVLAGIARICTACKKEFEPAVHNQVKCTPCADRAAKPVQCDRCENTFYRSNGESRTRHCGECRPIVRKERDCERQARKRRERGQGNLGDARVCACGTSFIRTNGFQKFCEPCSDIYYRTYHQRPERKNAQAQKRRTPSGALNRRMSNGMRYSLKAGKAGRSWVTMVDYTVEELMVHLERQFLPGMTWGKLADIHIDHIVPLASFKFESAEDPEFKAAWALTNLRPLWAEDNLKKNAKRTHLL